jgi:restriction system protein
MGVPDFQSLMRPVLVALIDGETRHGQAVREDVRNALSLTDEDMSAVMKSGQTVFYNRVQWATTYLSKAGAIERPQRGEFRITDRGRHLLQTCPQRITIADLSQYPEFEEFRTARAKQAGDLGPAVVPPAAEADELTPSERIETLITEMELAVADDLLTATLKAGDEFLERLAVALMTAMGYGGRDRNVRTMRSNDAGLDGIIRQDALGLDLVGVQAKCYALDRTVNRPDLQAFVGALQGAQTSRGVFVTTARFTAGAQEYAKQVGVRLVLIDGPELARLMLRYGLGVTVKQTYEVKEFDRDFFEES